MWRPGCSISEGQLNGCAHFCHGLIGNNTGAFGSIVQDIPDSLGVGIQFDTFLAERCQVIVQISRKAFLAFHTTDTCPAAFHVDHFHFPGGREDLVHGEDIAYIRIAGVISANALRVCHHLGDTLLCFFRCGSQFDVIIEALAHLIDAINSQYFGDNGIFHLRFDQGIRVITVIEGANQLARKFNMRRLVNSHGLDWYKTISAVIKTG